MGLRSELVVSPVGTTPVLKGNDFVVPIRAKNTGALAPEGNFLGQPQIIDEKNLYAELWTSLASLLRSYAAANGIHNNRHATIEATEEKITVSFKEKQLSLNRKGAIVTWTRENGSSGTAELSEAGRLRTETNEEEMDMAAEAWARELMR